MGEFERGSRTVIIAPDSFKGSISAREAAQAIAAGWSRVRPQDNITLIPQADGGEGTLDAVHAASPDSVRHPMGPVTGPDGAATPGEWLELPGKLGVVELAQCSGITLMPALNALAATTRGLGQVIRDALDHGMQSLIIALGGSASTDGGAGALSALGMRLLDAVGGVIADGGGALLDIERIDTRELVPPPPRGVVLLADVTAPLLGPGGAAAVFGPQKGASVAEVGLLESALERFASLLGGDPDVPGFGAAGGTAFGFATLWGATIESGARMIQELTGLTDTIIGADVVLTGEGSFDSTSLGGKVVGEVLALTARHSVLAGVIAGQIGGSHNPRTDASGVHHGSSHHSWECALASIAGSASKSFATPLPYLHQAGQDAARHFAELWATQKGLR